MSYSIDVNFFFSIDVVDSLVQQMFKLIGTDELEIAISRHLKAKSIKLLKKEVELSEEVEEAVAALEFFPVLSERYTLSYIELPISTERLVPLEV